MPRSASTATLADYLATGFWQEGGDSPHKFGDGTVTVNLSSLAGPGRALARAALDAWETVADITFREVGGRADIAFDDAGAGALTTITLSGGLTKTARVNVGTGWLDKYGTDIGSYSFHTYVHEIGHALGLGHGGRYEGGADYATDAKWRNDSWQQSVMSYFNQLENTDVDASHASAVSPMMADVMAIQKLYGAAKGGATAGDTAYGVGSDLGTYLDGVFSSRNGSLAKDALTIWDEGGTDTIDFGNDGRTQEVSLAAGSFSNVYGLEGNLGIAHGTTIENFTAGRASDVVIGNGASNTLKGGAGNDRLEGGRGSDTLHGGDGVDKLHGGEHGDRLHGNAGNDRLLGDGGNDRLAGGAGSDALIGGAGDDALAGDGGYDALDGGKGNDRRAGAADGAKLVGGSGADRLDGGAGGDNLRGGSGADRLVFTGGRDTVADFANDRDTLCFDDRLWGGGALSGAQLLDRAHVSNGDVVFDFGDGNTLRIDNWTSLDALGNDLAVV